MHVERRAVLCLIERSRWVSGIPDHVPDVKATLTIEVEPPGGRSFARGDYGSDVAEDNIVARLIPQLINGYETVVDSGHTTNVANKKLAPNPVSILGTDWEITHACAAVCHSVDAFDSVVAGPNVHEIRFDGMNVPGTATIHDESEGNGKLGESTRPLAAALFGDTIEEELTLSGGRRHTVEQAQASS